MSIRITAIAKKRFQLLLNAARKGDLCLASCEDAKTGQPVFAVCAVNRGEEYELVPLAKLFNNDPYEELLPPSL